MGVGIGNMGVSPGVGSVLASAGIVPTLCSNDGTPLSMLLSSSLLSSTAALKPNRDDTAPPTAAAILLAGLGCRGAGCSSSSF